MKRIEMLCAGALLAASALGCGNLAASRAVRQAAEADSNCPAEQIHVKGPVEGEAGVYEVVVCDRRRLYADATPEDKQWKFERLRRRAGASTQDTWAEHDGVASEAPAQAESSGGEADALDL